MKILCVCGLGMGSSLILKMTVEKAMRELGIPCAVEHQAAGMMSGLDPDLIVASQDFAEELAGRDNVVFVTNVVKSDEAKEKIQAFLAQQNTV
jgi:PTS system ascorbate-specific IIB component